MSRAGAPHVFLVAGEDSGDRLGAALMQALRQRAQVPLRFVGVGGTQMAAAGLKTLHSIDDAAIMGFSAIPRRFPQIVGRIFAINAIAFVALVLLHRGAIALHVLRPVGRAPEPAAA